MANRTKTFRANDFACRKILEKTVRNEKNVLNSSDS